MKQIALVMAFTTIIAAAGFVAFNRAAAQEPAASTGAVELDRCLVKPVNFARLATDRPGVLASIELKEGDAVKAGDLVARLMDEVAQANALVARLMADNKIEVEYAQKLNAVDATEVRKAEAANRQTANAVPDIDYQRMVLAEQRSKLQIDKAKEDQKVNEAKYKQAVAELNTYRILAPFDGVVTRIHKHKGEAIRQGDPVLEIVSTDVVQVEGEVDVKNLYRVKVGAPVSVRLDLPDVGAEVEKQVFQGKIGFVDVTVNDVKRTARVWAEVANPENVLRPGLRTRMTIHVDGNSRNVSTAKSPITRESKPTETPDAGAAPQ